MDNELFLRMQAVLYQEQGWDDFPQPLENLLNQLPNLDHGFNTFGCWMTIVQNTSHSSVYQRALNVFERLLPRLIMDRVNFLQPLFVFVAQKNSPELKEFLIEGPVRKFLLDKKVTTDIRGLLWIITNYPDPTFRDLALAKLEKGMYINNYPTNIASYWHNTRNKDLEKILLGLPWQTCNIDNSTRSLLALKTGQFNQMPELDTQRVGFIIHRCLDKDPEIAYNARMFLHTIPEEYLRLVTYEWWENRATELLNVLIARDYLPQVVTNNREWTAVALKLK